MATVKFFSSREKARIYAREEGETFRDAGTAAPKGSRWCVDIKDLSDMVNVVLDQDAWKKADDLAEVLNNLHDTSTEEVQDINAELAKAFKGLDIRPVIEKPTSIVRNSYEVLKDRKGNTIPVMTRTRVSI